MRLQYLWLSKIWLVLVYIFLYLPILSLIVFSFNADVLSSSWTGFTWHWYEKFFHDNKAMEALATSLQIAVASATIATVMGLFFAYVLVRLSPFPGKNLLQACIQLPLITPEIILGLALLLFFINFSGIIGDRGVLTIVIGHVLLGVAYATGTVKSRLEVLPKDLEEAGQILGASTFQVFYYIVFPQLIPSVLAAWFLTFTLSLDDVVVAFFLSGPGSGTLSMLLFSRAKLGLDPSMNVIAALMFVLLTSGLVVSYQFSKKPRHQVG